MTMSKYPYRTWSWALTRHPLLAFTVLAYTFPGSVGCRCSPTDRTG